MSKQINNDNFNSPDEDYEINEKELDENYNIYSDEGFEQLEEEWNSM